MKVLPVTDAEMFDLASETEPASQNPLRIDHSNTELKPCASQQETAPPVSMRDSNHADQLKFPSQNHMNAADSMTTSLQ